MENIVVINLYAEGYNSGAEHNEEVYLFESVYNLIKEQAENMELSIGGLDGKHSEVKGSIAIEILNEEEQKEYNFYSIRNDGDYILDNLYTEDIDIYEVFESMKSHIDKIDSLTSMEFLVKKSQCKLVKDFVDSLNK